MRRASIVIALVLAGCSSTYDQPPDQPPDRGPYRRAAVRDAGPMLLDIIPDDVWWRDVALVEPLHLTNDQIASLDKIAGDHRDEIERLDRDVRVASRDFRTALQNQAPTAADITAAAQRVRDLRNSLFDHQVRMLTAERLVLTDQQWAKLLDELQEQRRHERMNRDEGGYPRGGRGAYPRGGRGRPWPY